MFLSVLFNLPAVPGGREHFQDSYSTVKVSISNELICKINFFFFTNYLQKMISYSRNHLFSSFFSRRNVKFPGSILSNEKICCL